MTLIDVHEMFSSDAKCRELLKRLRWPLGPECPRCKGKAKPLNTSKDLLYCRDCDYQFTPTSGTIFHDSHLPLIKWFVCVYLLCESRKGMSANQMRRMLGVSYKTAWYLCHRVRFSMKQVDQQMLDGVVEMDETFVGGKRRNYFKQEYTPKSKEVVIGIRQRGGSLRFFHAQDIKSGTLAKFIRENISRDLDVFMTDEFSAYKPAVGMTMAASKHKTVNHSSRVYVQGEVHTNTIESAFSLLKRGIVGTWHSISAKHLQAYLDEMCFRFDRRNQTDIWLDTLRHMVTADPLMYETLTAKPTKLRVA